MRATIALTVVKTMRSELSKRERKLPEAVAMLDASTRPPRPACCDPIHNKIRHLHVIASIDCFTMSF
jgi:hypothetical protein